MARMRPIASDGQQAAGDDGGQPAIVGGRPPAPTLTPAEQHALSRCVPLSTSEFKAIGDLADRGRLPLGAILRRRQEGPRDRTRRS